MDATFLLGAQSFEMEEIRLLLEEAGQRWVQARHGGHPVTPATAYQADGPEDELIPVSPIVAVECGGPITVGRQVIRVRCRIWGKPASSLGQVVALLAQQGNLPDSWASIVSFAMETVEGLRTALQGDLSGIDQD